MNDQKKEGQAATLLSVPSLLKERWHIVRKLGGGGFGEIYEGRVAETGETCAVKVESNATPKQVLKMEAAVLRRLHGVNCEHSCQFFGAGRTDTINFVVMSLLGPNLSELRKKQPHGKFSWNTTFRLAMQMVAGVQAVHDCGFLHRDIKPSNFVMGSQPNTKHTCYILDFGLARQYVTATGEVREPRPIAGFRGTVRYASITAHRAMELGRHDDLWSLFYLLMECLHGQLPWRRLKEKEEVAKVKEGFNHNEFLVGLPVEFEMILSHLQRLDYHTCPDYSLLINLFEAMINRYGLSSDGPMDWEIGAVADSVPSSSVGAQRDGAVMEDVREGADGNDRLGSAGEDIYAIMNDDDVTNKTHCSAQENVSGGDGGGEKSNSGKREELPSAERGILQIVVEENANPEGSGVCSDEVNVEMGEGVNEVEGNRVCDHSHVGLVQKSDLVIEAASVEKGDLVKEDSDGSGDGDSCGDSDDVIHPVVVGCELVVHGAEGVTSGDCVRVASEGAPEVLSAREEEEEEAVYPEAMSAADGCKARESAFEAVSSSVAVTHGKEVEVGAECRAVVNVSVGEDGDSVVGGEVENGRCDAKQSSDGGSSCEADGKGGEGGVHVSDGVNAGVSVEGGDVSGDVEGDGASVEGDGLSGEGDGVSDEGDDSLQARLLQALAENETSHPTLLATAETLPMLPTDYDHLLRDSQWSVTDRMGTLQQLHDGSRVARIDSFSRAEGRPEGEPEGCEEKVVSGSEGEQGRVKGSSSKTGHAAEQGVVDDDVEPLGMSLGRREGEENWLKMGVSDGVLEGALVLSSDGDLEQPLNGEQLSMEAALQPGAPEQVCKEPRDDSVKHSAASEVGEGVIVSNGDMPRLDDGASDVKDDVSPADYSGDAFDEVVSELVEDSSEGEEGTAPQISGREEQETCEVAASVGNAMRQLPLEGGSPVLPMGASPPERSPRSSECVKDATRPKEDDPVVTTSVKSVEPVSPVSAHSLSPLLSASVSTSDVQKLLGISGLDPWLPVSLPRPPTTGTRPQCRDPRWKRFQKVTITSNA